MMRWKDRLTDTEDYFEEADDVASDSANKTALEVPSSSDFQSPSEHGDLAVTQDVAIGESTMDMPEEDQLPTIRPGDIVYIPQQTEERLLYMKAIYLGSNGQKFIAREWNSKQEVEVSMSALVPKTSFTEEERLEAEYLLATSAHGGRESQVGPRQHPRNILLSSQTIEELKLIAHQLETGEVELQEYDEGLVKPIFSKFLQQVNTRDSSHGLPLEDVVRIFYATTTSYFSEDNESTDQIWKADVERSAALLMDVLIGIVREGSDHSDEELAQIKAEHGQMIARASQAAKGARGDYIKQSVGELQDALDHLEIESETVEALKTRAHGVATGQEQLPGFGDKIVRQSFAKFSRRLKPTTPRGRHLVVEIMQEFESCVLSELIQLGRFEVGSTATTEALLKHKALLLSLLISVDAQLQFQHHGSAPRIRSRFTSLLMEERATYLLAISKERNESTNEPKKEPLNPRLLTNAPESHAKRTIFLQHIHKNIVRSNLELKSSTQPIQDIPPDRLKLLALSDQEVITLALDEEEKAAINQPEVYANIIKSRIAAYRNMKPEAFVDIVAQINRGKPVHTGLTDDRVPDVSSEELDADHRIAPHTEPSAIERPPRVMKCYQCQHSWTSTIAADFRDCPECGSYSVFADSPRRTASPDNTESPHRPKAHGEEAMGQYFSERTDKFMNLYRDKQPLPGSKQGSQESFPDPWSHLHGSHSSTSLSNAGMTKQDPLAADLHTTVCGSCGYRFSQSNILELVKCPKCNSKDTFVDLFSAEGRNHNQVEGIEASTQALHEAPPELTRLVHEIEDLAGDLKKLQDRHSSIVADVPVAVEQLLSLSAAFKLLIKLQEDPDHHIRFQRVQETVQVLCSSIKYTLEVASEALHVPFNETQWMFLCRRMQSDENVEFLERLRWYQKSASGLLEHVEGYTSMSLSARDANIESLLKRQQRTLEKPQSRTPLANLCSEPEESSATAPGSISCYSCHAQLSDVHKNADCPNCGSLTTAPPIPKIPLERMETEEAELVQRWKVSETAESAQIPQVYISRLLFGLIINARDAAGKLQALNKQYPHDSTGISAIVDQLMGLCGGFRRLSKLYEDSRNDSESAKAQGATQTICLSVQYTLDDVLGVFDTDSHETKWESWTRLTVQKSLMEKAGLSERLQWYLAAVLGLSHRLEGITSAGKISQWLGADEKIAALLERQERFLKTSQPATSSTIQLPAPTGLPDNQLPVAPLDVSDTNTKSRRPFDGFPTYELPSEATDTNTRSRRPYDDFPTDQLPAAPLEAFDTNTKYRRPFDGFPTDDRFEYEDHHPEGS
jgi:Zn finger protein HypA/HybF involved in hydrogenase expression